MTRHFILPYRIVSTLLLAAAAQACEQQPGTTAEVPTTGTELTSVATEPPVALSLYNWIHSTGDSERAFPFYRDVLDIELVRSPFAGPAPADAPPERIRPVSDADPDPLIWNLTNTEGSRFRNVFMGTPNVPFGLELSEFFDIAREERPANPWDPGASRLIFHVRDLVAVLARLEGAEAPSVTTGDGPVDTPAGRSILVRDPDGYLVQITQASPEEIAAAAAPGQVVMATIGLTVADTDTALRFYQGLLGFDVRGTRPGTNTELALNGLVGGQLTQTSIAIAGTDISVLLHEFVLPAGTEAYPIQWQIQDVGSPQFQLQVRNLDTLIALTLESGYRFLSVGAEPIQRPFGRFVFAIDPDGVLVEFVEPTPGS